MRKLALIIALMLVLGSANVCFAGGDLSIQTLKSGVGAAIGIVNKPMGDAVKNINLTQTARGMANVAVNALPLGTDMRASGRNFLNGEITGVSQQANAAIGAVSRDIRPLTSEAYKAGLSVHMGISKVQDMLPSINLNSFGAVTKSLPAIKIPAHLLFFLQVFMRKMKRVPYWKRRLLLL